MKPEKSDWYYVQGQETVGPISRDLLIALLGLVSRPADVLVWQKGLQDWTRAGDLPQFLRATNRPPPLPKTATASLPSNAGGERKVPPPATTVDPTATSRNEPGRDSILAKTKALGDILLGFAALLAILALSALFIFGANWLDTQIEYVAYAAGVMALVCAFIFLPLALFRVTRIVSVFGLLCSSYVFGLFVWLVGLSDSYEYCGLAGVVMGMALAGMGVVPIAVLAQAVQAEWTAVATMIVGIVLTFGTGMFSFWLADKV